jgi:hypothetical protein
MADRSCVRRYIHQRGNILQSRRRRARHSRGARAGLPSLELASRGRPRECRSLLAHAQTWGTVSLGKALTPSFDPKPHKTTSNTHAALDGDVVTDMSYTCVSGQTIAAPGSCRCADGYEGEPYFVDGAWITDVCRGTLVDTNEWSGSWSGEGYKPVFNEPLALHQVITVAPGYVATLLAPPLPPLPPPSPLPPPRLPPQSLHLEGRRCHYFSGL